MFKRAPSFPECLCTRQNIWLLTGPEKKPRRILKYVHMTSLWSGTSGLSHNPWKALKELPVCFTIMWTQPKERLSWQLLGTVTWVQSTWTAHSKFLYVEQESAQKTHILNNPSHSSRGHRELFLPWKNPLLRSVGCSSTAGWT